MFGVSKSLSKCFTVAEHQGVELLSFPYLQELSRSQDFLVLSTNFREWPTINDHQSSQQPPFPAKHQQGICTSTPRASSSSVALRVTQASQAASALAPVRARVLVIFSRDCGTNLFFVGGYPIVSHHTDIQYYIYIHLLSYIIFLIPGSIQGKIHRNLCYYRPITVRIVSPRSHHQTTKCAHIHLDWIHIDSMQTSPVNRSCF